MGYSRFNRETGSIRVGSMGYFRCLAKQIKEEDDASLQNWVELSIIQAKD